MAKFIVLLVCTIMCIPAIFASKQNVKLAHLRVEHLENPLGVNTLKPRFSWRVAEGAFVMQTAYELQVATTENLLAEGKADVWKTGKVKSREQVLVPYAGKALEPRHLYYWRVRAWYGDGTKSEWSEPQHFGVGILDGSMQGDFIGMRASDDGVNFDITTPILRSDFEYEASPEKRVLIHVNSLGYHELYVNGHGQENAVLAPAVVQLNKRSQIVTYDITSQLTSGINQIAIWLGTGWYKPEGYGVDYNGPLVRAEVDEIEGSEVKILHVTTDVWDGAETGYKDLGNWRPWRFDGELIDAAKMPRSMNPLDLNKLQWARSLTVNVRKLEATPQMCEPNRILEKNKPVSVKRLDDGALLVDFGKVATGWLQMVMPRNVLQKGDTVRIDYADNITMDGKWEGHGEHDFFISAGAPQGEKFVNKFNHHAFRYVKIYGLKAEPESILQLPFSGNYEKASSFECSDENLNAIHNMVQRTLQCLTFSGYQVDCPHIERQGYGGDGNSSALTAQMMYDLAPTYYNWLQGWADAYSEEDGLPHVAPIPYGGGGGPYWCEFVVKAPWRLYQNYGDVRILEKMYPVMEGFMRYVKRYTVEGLLQKWPDTKLRGWYLGDWLPPAGVDVGNPSVDLVNNCVVSESYLMLSKIATLLGRDDEAEFWAENHETLNKLIHKVFYNEEKGIYGTGSQLDMTYPMLVGVVPADLQEKINAKVLELTASKHNNHIAVGLVGVPILAEWATANHKADFMKMMLDQQDYPGYMHMINNGATATWEYWDGQRSHVHNCYNGIGSWFYQSIGGIIPDDNEPGYRHFTIDVQVPETMTWAKVSKTTAYGEIAVNWEKKDGKLLMNVKVPSGSSATIKVPKGTKISSKMKNYSKNVTMDVTAGEYFYEFSFGEL